MLDVCGDAEEFGKPIGSDAQEGKVTFVDLLGLRGCGRAVRARTEAARPRWRTWTMTASWLPCGLPGGADQVRAGFPCIFRADFV